MKRRRCFFEGISYDLLWSRVLFDGSAAPISAAEFHDFVIFASRVFLYPDKGKRCQLCDTDIAGHQ